MKDHKKELNNLVYTTNDLKAEISIPCLFFKNREYEDKYKKYKIDQEESLKLLWIIVAFNLFLIGLRSIQAYFNVNMDLRIAKVSQKTTLLYLLFCNFPTIAETIIYFCKCLRILRGFAISIFPFIGIVIYSNEYCNSLYNTSTPMFITATVIYLPVAFITALTYSSNWICGFIQVFCYNLIIIIGIWVMPGNIILDKPWFILMMIPSALSSFFTLYYNEYFQRKSFLLKLNAEKQVENLEKLIEALPSPFIVSFDGKVKYANKAFDDFPFGPMEVNRFPNNVYQPPNDSYPENRSKQVYEERIESKIEKIQGRDIHESLSTLVKSQKKLEKMEFQVAQSENRIKLLEISTTSIYFDMKEYIIYFFNDITRFIEINPHPNPNPFSSSINAKNAENWQNFELVAYDFKRLLKQILDNTELLSTLFFKNNWEQPSYLSDINYAASLMSLSVQDVFDFPLLQSSNIKINPTEFDLESELNKLLNLLHIKFKSKKLSLKYKNENIVNLINNDLDRIKLILFHIISNSLKFTFNQEGVLVKLKHLGESGLIEISVIDRGIGIPQAFLSNIFQPYFKMANRGPEIESKGLGLGLYKSKQLIKHLGGDIEVESQAEIGSNFTITFKKCLPLNNPLIVNEEIIQPIPQPLSNEEVKKGGEIYPNSPPDSHRILTRNSSSGYNNCECSKILIIDHYCDLSSKLAIYAMQWKLQYDETESEKKAIEFVRNKIRNNCCLYYKKILFHYHFGDMKGINLALQIKKELKNNYTKLILVSEPISGKLNIKTELGDNLFSSIEFNPIEPNKLQQIIYEN